MEYTVEFRDLRTLKPNPRNPYDHPPVQQDRVRASLARFGWVYPVIVNDRTGNLVDGHDRVQQALKLGETVGPVFAVDLSPADEREMLLVLNRTTEERGTRDDVLLELLQAHYQEKEQPPATWTSAEYEQYIRAFSPAPAPPTDEDVDQIPERAPERATLGDVWVLGEHRIGCVDARDEAAVLRVTQGVTPCLVFADPPYGIRIVRPRNGRETIGGAPDGPFGGKGRASILRSKPFGKSGTTGRIGSSNWVRANHYAPIIGDETTETAITSYFLLSSLWPKAIQVWWGAHHYADQLPPSSGWLVWDKETTGDFGDGELAWTSEERAVRIFTHRWSGCVKESERDERRCYPSQKPVALAAWVFETMGEVLTIFDPFLGSGCALLAAEKTGRRLLGCDLLPQALDICIDRWEKLTGRKATLVEQLPIERSDEALVAG